MSPAKQQHTFISYSRSNMDFALRLARQLKESGFPVWVDQMDIPVGARWDDELEIALDTCGIFLVILTPASIASSNVKDEIGYAIDNGKRILPVLLEQCNVPLRLRRFQHVDFTTTSFEDGVEIAKQLLYNYIEETKPPQSLIANIKKKSIDNLPVESAESSADTSASPNEVKIPTQKGKREYFDHKMAEWQLKLKEEEQAKVAQQEEAQLAANSISEVAPQVIPSAVDNSKESIWKFGKSEILRGLIGLVIFSVISILFRQVLSGGFLVFFALAYGPWVGLFIGFAGSIFPLAFPNSFINPLFFGIVGLVVGLFTKKFGNFRDYRQLLWAIGLGEVTALAGFVPLGIIPVSIGNTIWSNVIILFLITFFANLFILPILMITFAKTVGHAQADDSTKPSTNPVNPTVWIMVGAVLAGAVFVCGCVVLAYWLSTQYSR